MNRHNRRMIATFEAPEMDNSTYGNPRHPNPINSIKNVQRKINRYAKFLAAKKAVEAEVSA